MKVLTQTWFNFRRQQRPHSGGGGGKNQPQQIQQQSPQQQRDQTQPQSQNQQELNLTELGDNRNHSAGRPPRQHQVGHPGPRQGGPPHHGYSQNRRWHHNQKGHGHGQTYAAGDKEGSPKLTKETENVKVGDQQIRPPQECNINRSPNESPNESPKVPPSGKASNDQTEQPKVSLLQSSKERLRRRLKDKVLKISLVCVRLY